MIKLLLNHGLLFIDATDDTSILTGAHRSFFELAAGYQRDVAAKRYTLNAPSTKPDILIDTIEYLKGEGLDFEVDATVQSLLDEIKVAEQSFSTAVTAGLKVKKATMPSSKIPGFQRRLKPYQIRSVQHLISVCHGANFSVPGSGKTTIVYAAFAVLQARQILDKLFVIGPRSCFMPWEEEYFQCFGKNALGARLTGEKKDRRIKYRAVEDYDLFLCTYQTASNDVAEIIDFCRSQKVLLVLDESHNVKKPKGGVWAQAVLDIAHSATRRVILTGTPAPNSLEDLWTQMTFLWPGKQILGSQEQYALKCEDEGNFSSIQTAIKPFFMRIRKDDLGLPLQHFDRVKIPMSPYQANIYKALSVKFISELSLMPEEGHQLREWRKAKMVRLLQTASNPTLLAKRSDEFGVPPLSGEGVSVLQLLEDYPKYEKPAKFEVAERLIRKLLSTDHKVLLWTSFILNIQMLQKQLDDLKPLILYGAVPQDETENEELNREQQIRTFRESKTPIVLLANPAACAESISLHKFCRHAIYLDRTFDCGRYMQSLDRIHRIGLGPKEDVFYHILECVDTIDETIDRRLEEKQTVMKELLEDEEVPIGTFEIQERDETGIESEEKADFAATIEDLKKQIEKLDIP